VTDKYRQLLEVYSLEEILERLEVEPEDVLALLDEQGLLHLDVEPL
jgi:hypothetical protein